MLKKILTKRLEDVINDLDNLRIGYTSTSPYPPIDISKELKKIKNGVKIILVDFKKITTITEKLCSASQEAPLKEIKTEKIHTPEFITHNNDPSLEADGSFFQGEIEVSYMKLRDKLGKPTTADEHKVDAEWIIEFGDGTIGTIYNWKNGHNYLGTEEGSCIEDITDWHIGGKEKKVVSMIQNLLSKTA